MHKIMNEVVVCLSIKVRGELSGIISSYIFIFIHHKVAIKKKIMINNTIDLI